MLSYVADSTPGIAQSIYEYLKTLPVLSQNQLTDLSNVISMAINGALSGLSVITPPDILPENTSATYLADQYMQNADIARLYEDERPRLWHPAFGAERSYHSHIPCRPHGNFRRSRSGTMSSHGCCRVRPGRALYGLCCRGCTAGKNASGILAPRIIPGNSCVR